MDAIKKEYRAAADALRGAEVETPEMLARYEAAQAAHKAAFPPATQPVRGWYDLPIAERMWNADRKQFS